MTAEGRWTRQYLNGLSVWTYFTSQYIWTRHDKYAVNRLTWQITWSTYLANYLSSSSRLMVSVFHPNIVTSVFFNHTALAVCKMHSTIQTLQRTSLTGVLGRIQGIQGQTLMYITDTWLVTSHTLTYNWYVYLVRAIVNALDSYWRKTSESIHAFVRICSKDSYELTFMKNFQLEPLQRTPIKISLLGTTFFITMSPSQLRPSPWAYETFWIASQFLPNLYTDLLYAWQVVCLLNSWGHLTVKSLRMILQIHHWHCHWNSTPTGIEPSPPSW